MKSFSLGLIFLLLASPCFAKAYHIKASVNLPSNCFTQGFLIQQQQFYLSCGRYQHSSLYRLNKQGNILKHQVLPKQLFAEGIAIYQKQLWLLTWKSQQSFPINLQTLAIGKPLSNSGQGWGLTTYQNTLLQSNGSHFLYTLHVGKHITKQQSHAIFNTSGQPLPKLNELERLPNFIAANIWQQNRIVFIALPLKNSQRIAFQLNLQELAQKHQHQGVLNGIAFDKQTGCLWVTGKMWPKAYALAISHPKLTLACNIQP